VIVFPDLLPPLNRKIVELAQKDIPILEDPPGSNRSPEIDRMCKRWGVPLASAWCALWTSSVWFDAGAIIPPVRASKDWHPAKADSWYQWAKETGALVQDPVIGAAVLYGKDGVAHHIACCVVSVTPKLLAFEGNTSETGFSREGELTEMKRVNHDRLLGYVLPVLR
jgi:hypothetical protein